MLSAHAQGPMRTPRQRLPSVEGPMSSALVSLVLPLAPASCLWHGFLYPSLSCWARRLRVLVTLYQDRCSESHL